MTQTGWVTLPPESQHCQNLDAKNKCLTIHGSYDGALVSMKDENNLDQQVWRYTEDKYIQSQVLRNGLVQDSNFVLNVMWADIPLLTNGATVNVWHKKNSISQKWTLLPI